MTALAVDPRVSGYVIVEVDGARYTSLPAEVVGSLGLEAGRELAALELQALTAAADQEAAYQVAVRLLATRPRAVRELLRGLRVRGHDDRACEAALERLQAQELVDDAAFARHFVSVRSARGHGPARLSADLQERGVDRQVAERVVRETLAEEGIDPDDAMRRLAARRAGQLGSLDPKVKRRRLLSYLARRGYDTYRAHDVVNDLLGPNVTD